MKKLLTILFLLTSMSLVYSQRVKEISNNRLPISPKQPASGNQEVFFYENINYAGRFQVVTPQISGNKGFPMTHFNDMVSSVQVPSGMVAILYEYANEQGGYGKYVELMESCPDLSVYDLNDKISFVSVFPSSKSGYNYIRAKKINGQMVSGHWERKKANGQLPDNLPPALVQYLEPPLPTRPSVLTVHGTNTVINTLGIQTPESRSLWEMAVSNQLGIIGNDYRGIEEIGSACFERASNNPAIPDFLNFWYPQKQQRDHRPVKYFKRTLAGEITRVHQVNISGTFEDYDVNIDIKPDLLYKYLLTDAHKPEYTNLMKSQHYGSLGYSGESDCPKSFDELEAEISDKHNPQNGYESKLIELTGNRIGKKICVYGTWIWDEGHCCHPEIHPAEQIWWNNGDITNKKYFLNVICDASRRFWWRNQMDDGTKLKPWAAPPIKGLFAIAFEYALPSASPISEISDIVKVFEVSNIEYNNVIEYPNANQTYSLMYNGKAIVSFIPHNDAFKVSFEQVGISPADRNKVRGFLVIETSVGKCTQTATSIKVQLSPQTPAVPITIPPDLDPNKIDQRYERRFFKKEEGHYYFTITEKNVNKISPVFKQ